MKEDTQMAQKTHENVLNVGDQGNKLKLHITRENHNFKRQMHPNVHSSTIYNNQSMEAT